MRAFPDVLSRTPNEVEEAIFVRAKTKVNIIINYIYIYIMYNYL